MEEEINPNETIAPVDFNRPRPLLLSVLCMFSLAGFGLISLVFLAGLLNSGWITAVTNQYLPKADYTRAQTLWIFGAGFILHSMVFTGILLIWFLRKAGYYLLGISCLILATYQLLNPVYSIFPTALYIILILLFGIFFKRYH